MTGAADALTAVTDDLPAAVRAHPGLASTLHYLDAVDPDIAGYHLYIEWNPSKGSVDPSIVLPTRAFGSIPLAVHDLAADLTAPLGGPDLPGCALLTGVCDRIRATPIDHRLFPRAFSVSFEGLGRDLADGDVGLVFLDLGPPLDLQSDPGGVAAAFRRLVGEDPGDGAQDIARLTQLCAGMRLDHVGAGRRRGHRVHKAYLGGRLDDLAGRTQQPALAARIGGRRDELQALAEALDHRPAVMVVDVVHGDVTRVGFELNLDVKPELNAGYADLVRESALFAHAPLDLQAAMTPDHRVAVERPLPGGYAARLELSHVKVSFDGGQTPEWKMYLRVQKVPGTEMSERSTG